MGTGEGGERGTGYQGIKEDEGARCVAETRGPFPRRRRDDNSNDVKMRRTERKGG